MNDPSPQSAGADLLSGWIQEHGGAVRGYVMSMVRRPDVADDLVQEVFHRAWQARRRYRETGNARAYLLRIADRLVCDRGRKADREITLTDEHWEGIEPTADDTGPMESLAKTEMHGRLADALNRLSMPQRRVLMLRYYGEMSFSQIAEIMGFPLNTALSHCHRGLLTLRKMFVEDTP